MVQLISILFTTLISYSSLATAAHTFSAWSGNKYTGTEFATSGTGTFNLGFKAKSYKWSSGLGDGCCVKLCNGAHPTGDWCNSHSNPGVVSANQFNKVVIGCSSAVLNC